MSDPRNSPGVLPFDATDPRGAAAYSQLYQLPWAQPQVGYQPQTAPQVGYQPPQGQWSRKSDVPRPQAGAFRPGDWIKHWEGIDWTPNDDGYGNPTLGYGHLLTHEEQRRGYIDTPGGRIPTRGRITPQQAEALFQLDYQNSVRDLQAVPGFSQLNPNQQEAVISYYFNTGRADDIARVLATGNPQTLANFLQRGISTAGGGRYAPGLAKRRGEEAQLAGAPSQGGGGPDYTPPQQPSSLPSVSNAGPVDPGYQSSQGGPARISPTLPPYYTTAQPGGGQRIEYDPTRAATPTPLTPQAPTPAPTEPVTREPLPDATPTLPPESFGVPSPPRQPYAYNPPTWSRGPLTTETPPSVAPAQATPPPIAAGGGPPPPIAAGGPWGDVPADTVQAPSPSGGLVTGLPPQTAPDTPPLPPTQPGPGVTDGGDQAASGPGGTAAKPAAPPQAGDGMLPGGPPFPNVGSDRGQPQQQPTDQPDQPDRSPPSQPAPQMEAAAGPAWDRPAPPEPVGYSGRTGGIEPGRGPQDALPSGAVPQMAADPGGGMPGPQAGENIRTLATEPGGPPATAQPQPAPAGTPASTMPATPSPGGTAPQVPLVPAAGAGASAPAGGLEGGGEDVPVEGGPDLGGGGGGQVAEPVRPYSQLGDPLVPGGRAPGQAPAQAPAAIPAPGQDIGFGPGNQPVTAGLEGYDPQNPLTVTFGITEAGRDYRDRQRQRMDEANQRIKEADDLLSREDPERAQWREYYKSRIAAKEEAATAMRNLMLHPPHRAADDTFQAVGALTQAMGMLGGSMGMVSGAGAINAMAAAIRANTTRNDADFKDSMETWKSEANMAYQLFNMENSLKGDALQAYGTDPTKSITKVGDALQRIAIRFGNNGDLQKLAEGNFSDYMKSFKAQSEAIDAYWSTTLSGIQKLNFMHAYTQGLDEAAAKLSPQERAVNMQQWPQYRGAPPSAALDIFNKNFEATAEAGVPGFAGKGGKAGAIPPWQKGATQNIRVTYPDGRTEVLTGHYGPVQSGLFYPVNSTEPVDISKAKVTPLTTSGAMTAQPAYTYPQQWEGMKEGKPPEGIPEDIYQGAINYVRTGRMPALGMQSAQRTEINRAVPAAAHALNINPLQMVEEWAKFQGFTSGQRALGTRAAALAVGIGEAAASAPAVIQTSQAVYRTPFPPVNEFISLEQFMTGSVEEVRFRTALNTFLNTYARAINPQGRMTDQQQRHAYEVLSTNFNQGQIEGGVAQLLQELGYQRNGLQDAVETVGKLLTPLPAGQTRQEMPADVPAGSVEIGVVGGKRAFLTPNGKIGVVD